MKMMMNIKKKIALFMFLFILSVNVSAVIPDTKKIMIGGGGRIMRIEKYKQKAIKKEVRELCCME